MARRNAHPRRCFGGGRLLAGAVLVALQPASAGEPSATATVGLSLPDEARSTQTDTQHPPEATTYSDTTVYAISRVRLIIGGDSKNAVAKTGQLPILR